MKTVKDIFYFVEDVMTITGLSRSKSYKIIADLNRELSDRGYRNFDDHGRLLRLRRLEYALFGGLKCSELSKTAAASA